ncbi:proteolipid protein 2-like [Arapaima gigas]
MADTAQSGSSESCLQKLNTYVRTRKGTILAAEIVVSVIIIICFAASLYGGYSAVAVCEGLVATLFFFIFMLGLDNQIHFINWACTDFIRALIGGILYLIIALICLIGGAGDGARIAGGVFSLVASILFGYDTFFTFKSIKSSSQHNTAPTEDFA